MAGGSHPRGEQCHTRLRCSEPLTVPSPSPTPSPSLSPHCPPHCGWHCSWCPLLSWASSGEEACGFLGGPGPWGPPRWPWCTTCMEPLLPAEVLEMSSALSFHKNSFCEHLKKQNWARVRHRPCIGLISVLRSSNLPDAPPAASVLCSVPKCRVRAEPLARTPSCFHSGNCALRYEVRGSH